MERVGGKAGRACDESGGGARVRRERAMQLVREAGW